MGLFAVFALAISGAGDCVCFTFRRRTARQTEAPLPLALEAVYLFHKLAFRLSISHARKLSMAPVCAAMREVLFAHEFTHLQEGVLGKMMSKHVEAWQANA